MKRDDIREFFGGSNPETIAHHEECLQAALEDMSRERPPRHRAASYDEWERAWGWAQVNAQKHYDALRKVRGWSLPEEWERQYRDAFEDLNT